MKNKHLTLIIIALIQLTAALTLCVTPQIADAADIIFVRAERDDIWFYRTAINSDSEKMFLIEKSYYLKVVDSTPLYYQVEIFDNSDGFYKILGFVKRSEVALVNDAPTLPLYPKYTLSVVSSSANMYLLANSSSQITSTLLYNQSLRYYGKYTTDNAVWYYIRFGQDYGYVQSTNVTAPNYTLHPTPLPVVAPPVDNPEQPPEPDDDSLLQIILVALICVPAVVIVFTLFNNGKQKATLTQPHLQGSTQKQTLKPRFVDDREDFNDYDLL